LSATAHAAQDGMLRTMRNDFPAGRPFPWAEVIATLLTISLLLWAAQIRRAE